MTPEQAARAAEVREELRRKAVAITETTNMRRVLLGRAMLRWLRGADLKAFNFVKVYEGGEGE